MEFRDEYDDLEHTGHCLVRFKGKPVASTRIVNGKFGPLEAEDYKWVDIREEIRPFVNNENSIAEPSRVVGEKRRAERSEGWGWGWIVVKSRGGGKGGEGGRVRNDNNNFV